MIRQSNIILVIIIIFRFVFFSRKITFLCYNRRKTNLVHFLHKGGGGGSTNRVLGKYLERLIPNSRGFKNDFNVEHEFKLLKFEL